VIAYLPGTHQAGKTSLLSVVLLTTLYKQQVLSFPEEVFNRDCLAHFWELHCKIVFKKM